MTRDSKGRFARRGYSLLFILVVIAAGVIFFHFAAKNNTVTYTAQVATSTEQVASSTDPLDAIKARENFQKRIENEAQQVYFTEQIADRKAKMDALKMEVSSLEAHLEKTRSDELSFQ